MRSNFREAPAVNKSPTNGKSERMCNTLNTNLAHWAIPTDVSVRLVMLDARAPLFLLWRKISCQVQI
jgi:hypothetical protein